MIWYFWSITFCPVILSPSQMETAIAGEKSVTVHMDRQTQLLTKYKKMLLIILLECILFTEL